MVNVAQQQLRDGPTPDGPPRHWYYDADPDDRREYDAFGPWIGEIASEKDLPRAFRSFWPRLREARFLLKFPIDVERARVRPGWDLYKAVLAVEDGGLVYLRQASGGVVVEENRWEAIAAVRSYTNLLVGRWRLVRRDGGGMEIDYNTVSSRVLDAVTDYIRARIAWEAPVDDAQRPNAGLAVSESLFRNLLAQMRRTGPQPATVIHFEPAGRWCRDGGRWRHLATARMMVATPAELILVDRAERSRPFWSTNYAAAVTTIPWPRLTGFAFLRAGAARLPRFHELTLDLGRASIRFPCLDTPDAVIAALVARGVPERSA